ncbi:MAG: anthranilate phosphoribosyltransferase [Actinobacteria bacterium]|nr:anthranilate phosphoribosyltransferase [Actinomycetota bacterium]
MIKEIIEKVIGFKNLNKNEAYAVMNYFIEGKANDCEIASFLTALRMKGETSEEITGFCRAMLEKVKPVRTRHEVVVDTCGTGGDRKNTFNISTAAALIAAGAGVIIAKHGNRSVSSLCGSIDVLEALGVKTGLDTKDVSECIDSIGIGFIFAPIAHPALRNVAEARKKVGIRTVFNILGPIVNPAGASARVLGVYSKHLTDIVAAALKQLGVKRAMVVHGEDGMDEISITASSFISELKDGKIRQFILNPEDFGFKSRYSLDELKGSSPAENAEIIRNILGGSEKGAKRDVSILNAAAVILVSGNSDNLNCAIDIAADSIDSGKALKKLNDLIKFTNKNFN